MAKGNLFLGQARGKVGDLVFSRALGKQIIRSRATSVANPKTYGQNVQRCILASIAKAAAALTPIVDHSFASITYGAESVRHFRKINMAKMRDAYLNDSGLFNYVPKGGSYMPGEYIISQGNLPAFDCIPTDGANPIFVQGQGRLSDNADVTVKDFKAAYPYIQGGDQLTLVTIEKISGSFSAGTAVCATHYDRIVLAPNALANDDDQLFEGDEFAESLLDMTKTTNISMLKIIGVPGSAALGFTRASGGSVVACALILSRQVNGQWQRSTQSITLLEADDVTDPESSIASYGAQASLSSDTEYLNQANEGTSSAGVSGAYMQFTASGENAPASFSLNPGQSRSLGAITIETGEALTMNAVAYGTDDNPLVALDLEGTTTDGDISMHGTVRNNTAAIVFNIGEDANLVGTYTLTAVYRSGRAVTNFTLSTGA